jgi:mRNA interferase RelE/StbE
MPYEVPLTKTAKKIYLNLPSKLRAGLEKCFANLEINPKSTPNIKKIKGFQVDYRYQVGGWRILYEVNEDQKLVTVYEIKPRGDVYKHSHN